MKKLLPLVLAIVMALTAYGESDDVSGFTIYPHIGWTDGSDIDNDNHFGIGLGYRFNSPWGVEVVYQNSDAEVDGAPGGDADYDTWRLDGLYHVDSGQSWKPFLSFGVGRSEYDYDNLSDDRETQLNVGLGINFPMNDNTSWRADAKLYHGTDDNELNSTVSVGLYHVIGSKPVQVAEAPADGDADRDGVPDSQDQCPGTPMGVEVDAIGCPLDEDGDGVPNHADNCPNTTNRKARIDARGCYVMLDKKVSIELNVEFDFDSSDSRPEHKPEVKRVADFMEEYPKTKVVMEGHTDSSGPAEYNQGLSERCAKTVADMLTSDFGISERRVSSKGYGESQPIDTNDTKEGRQNNRRVTAQIEAHEEVVEEK